MTGMWPDWFYCLRKNNTGPSIAVTMRIIAWNCNMAFRKKFAAIAKFKADILVIPECEHPDKINFPTRSGANIDRLWIGHNPNKGLGIFAYGQYQLSLHKSYNPDFKLIAPIQVTGGDIDFTLFAIWANNPSDKDGVYVEQIWKAIHYYAPLFKKQPVVLAGDFNSNSIWDRKRRISNHSNVVAHLQEKGIESTYHLFHNQQQGKEKHPTQYMYRHKNKPYHLDYCFASKELSGKLESVKIGSHKKWSLFSDHVPVIVNFKTEE